MLPDLRKAEECRKLAGELRAKAAAALEGPDYAFLCAAANYDYIARSIEDRVRNLDALRRQFARRTRRLQIHTESIPKWSQIF